MIVKYMYGDKAFRIYENVADVDFYEGSGDSLPGLYLNIHNAEEVVHVELTGSAYIMTDAGKTIDKYEV